MSQVIFAKYSSMRRKDFRISTCIYQSDIKKFVKKIALTSETQKRFVEITELHSRLKDQLKNKNARLCEIVEHDKSKLVFEYIEGNTLEKELHQFIINKDKEQFHKSIESFWNFLNTAFDPVSFQSNKLFSEIFPSVKADYFNNLQGFSGVANIDMNFDNLIIENGDYHVFDLDWLFDCNIPLAYIFYRSLNSFYIRIPEAEEIVPEKSFYEQLGISEYLTQFSTMEIDFQNYANSSSRHLDGYLKESKTVSSMEHSINILKQEQQRLDGEVKKWHDETARLNNENGVLVAEVNRYENSKSWRYMKFFRYLSRLIKR